MPLYQIKDWDVHFENSKSRERDKCSFCCIPNKQDGLGYGRLIRLTDGNAMYGAFVSVLLMASKQPSPRRGYLTDTGLPTGCPLTARDMSVKTQFDETLIQKMLDAVSRNNIGWIDILDGKTIDGQAAGSPVPVPCPSGALKEGKKEVEGKKSIGAEIQMTATPAGVHLLVQQVAQKLTHVATEKLSTLDELKKLLGQQYQRPDGHVWSYAEESELAEIARRPNAVEELNLILAFQRRLPPPEKKFFPQSISKLISKWDDILDRARFTKPVAIKSRPLAPLTGKRFTHSPELGNKFRAAVQSEIQKANL